VDMTDAKCSQLGIKSHSHATKKKAIGKRYYEQVKCTFVKRCNMYSKKNNNNDMFKRYKQKALFFIILQTLATL
jgi:hypothetical protein